MLDDIEDVLPLLSSFAPNRALVNEHGEELPATPHVPTRTKRSLSIVESPYLYPRQLKKQTETQFPEKRAKETLLPPLASNPDLSPPFVPDPPSTMTPTFSFQKIKLALLTTNEEENIPSPNPLQILKTPSKK